MDELQRQVRRAERRLAAQRLVGALGWCWFVSLLVALALVVAEKFHPLGFAAWTWAGGALGGAMVVGLIAALAWAIWTRQRPLAAAIELDHRFQLKERVSSTLAMPAEARATEAGRAGRRCRPPREAHRRSGEVRRRALAADPLAGFARHGRPAGGPVREPGRGAQAGGSQRGHGGPTAATGEEIV